MTENSAHMLVVTLNARLRPMDRSEIFEDPLDASLQEAGLGEVSGGGTQVAKNGEVTSCDVEISVNGDLQTAIDHILERLGKQGAPKGSKLRVCDTGAETPLGWTEGLALYLNGTDLPDEVYGSCDVNVVVREIESLLEGKGFLLSYWEGPTETALYFYGPSFEYMQARMQGFLASYPLCAQSRVEQIA